VRRTASISGAQIIIACRRKTPTSSRRLSNSALWMSCYRSLLSQAAVVEGNDAVQQYRSTSAR
jgi:hypothetical protein